MICSRRLYKGNAYEICLPLTDTGVTLVRFYTKGDVIVEKEPEISGDSMCFSFTEEDLALLEDGVLRYGHDDFDTNAPYVVVTPGDYSGSTLDDLLEDAYDSGYTAGQEDCSGSTTDADLIANLQGDYYVIPEGTTSLRDYAFAYACFSSITIPDSVTEIGFGTFCNSTCLTSITIPDSVQSVGQSAFWNCRGLLSVTIGSGLTGLSDTMFSAARSLTGITIPSTVTSIGNSTFATCSGLTHMTFEGLVPPTLASISGGTASLGSSAYTFPIYVPCESVEDYKTAFGQYYSPRITCSGSPTPVYSAMPLTFEIISGGTIGWNSPIDVEIEYSMDCGATWDVFSEDITVNDGDMVQFRGTGETSHGTTSASASSFVASGVVFNACGNLYSLLDKTNYTEIDSLASYNNASLAELFRNNEGLVSAENLKLPATTMARWCYDGMFNGCTSLTTAPELPALTLASYCYQAMFRGCTSLTTAPELPAMVLAYGCYNKMFTTCTNLNHIKCLATSISATGYVSEWVDGVSETGTFVKAPGVTWPSGESGIPAGWTVVDAT